MDKGWIRQALAGLSLYRGMTSPAGGRWLRGILPPRLASQTCRTARQRLQPRSGSTPSLELHSDNRWWIGTLVQ